MPYQCTGNPSTTAATVRDGKMLNMDHSVAILYSACMRILGVETSCDETAVAIVRDGRIVESSAIASSRTSFEHLSGVIPEEAARRQVQHMIPVLAEALSAAHRTMKDIDAIAVTKGPGLLGSLLIGTLTARTLASVYAKPLIGVHHTLGHLSSPWLLSSEDPVTDILFPVLTLSVSGGHSDLWLRTSHIHGTLLGSTRDDAAGEAFDKGANLLGLPYPGGPAITKASEGGDAKAHAFPLPLKEESTLDFSFSGLKTSLRYLLRDLKLDPSLGIPQARIRDIAASYQYALCAHLVDRVTRALEQHGDIRELHCVGGVSANPQLRLMLHTLCAHHSIPLRVPLASSFCTDNAAMIASAGFFLHTEDPTRAYAPFETTATLALNVP